MKKDQVKDCEDVISSMEFIVENINEVIKLLDREAIICMLQKILGGERVFLMGAGRSGLVAKAFAMRLMHLGFTVYVVGETTTPAVRPQDVVIAISGSGETRSIADLGKIVKDIGSTLITVTSKKESTLGKISDIAMILPSKTKNDHDVGGSLEKSMRGDYKNSPPLGTAFEIISLVFLDSLIAQLITLTGASEAELKSRHTNIE
ncbi:6-phospho 3-hexuloisomerase [Methanosarcina sp. 2.H.T.1A.6]|uniref:6-phospho-3-hexuloisomerase n=1 Tax=unclassified Methanosarcina TaxID=2644672 RepID=UPI0006217D71|nr:MULTISPECIES: 6-phospho-3-hexuloisomerase [unclassified Methanosarcina]KKG09185.1 6-phospho 3-hexuloisomerase [Methanosarcina sp. 2.H.A.1B.4]KKG14997.1 6-phospho 3-hexuloisomerase [Methanosarcina sp. 2.H.T.1A.3]KKG20696.1 6-phospho 3-hexuloisomerase [Methanosarcina sp. 2.H.T.1A.8]KKG22013.1 6-phospho 3-hexuloisomerase [Methanosarcina sp. 2.H.T.1A.6]KKG28650.1 6-phospho 3-hexuloisomerase [Methanosarcina sp. 2.H.T.1A.15]